jgi:hypothetical protein
MCRQVGWSTRTPIRVEQILATVWFVNVRPALSKKRVVLPAQRPKSQIRIPGDADPIKFQPLHLELGRGVFEVITGTRVIHAVQKPVNRIDVHAHIDRMRLQPLGSGRGDKTVTFGASRVFAHPPLRSYNRLHRLTLGTTCHGTRVTWAPVPVSAPYGDVGV